MRPETGLDCKIVQKGHLFGGGHFEDLHMFKMFFRDSQADLSV